ncbi:MAG: hypothetical protein ACHQ1D_01055 [Nitrososphaerales archaeon]
MGWWGNDTDLVKPSLKKKIEVEEDDDDDEEEEDDDEDESPETYDITIECSNCPDEIEYEVPFGKRWQTHLKDEICENCGCLIIDSNN